MTWLDIDVDQGTTYNNSLTLLDVNYNPISLANTLVVGTVKKSYITSNVAATISITIADSANGVIYYGLPWWITANMNAPYRYVYDIVTVNQTSNIATRVLEGTLYLNPSVSTTP